MVKVNLKGLLVLVLSVTLVIGIMLGGCTTSDESGTPAEETQTQIIENITSQEAFDLIQDNQNNPYFAIIDVRTPQEYSQERIAGAINIDFNSVSFRNDLDKLDKDRTYIVYCRTGFLSGKALDIMGELGFQEVYKPSGGIEAWIDAGLPVTGTNGQGLNGDDPM